MWKNLNGYYLNEFSFLQSVFSNLEVILLSLQAYNIKWRCRESRVDE